MPPRIAIPVPTSTDAEYNRRSWPQYAAAVTRSGGQPVEIPLTDPPATTARLIASCQGVLLPGSPADVNPQKYGQQPQPECAPPDPARENVDELLLQDAHNMGKPILAICFGAQMLNVWRGGTLLQHLLPMPVNHAAGASVAVAHTAAILPDSLLGQLAATEASPAASTTASASAATTSAGVNLQPATSNLQLLRLPINSSHHQAIGIPGDGLRVTARSTEDGVVEAVEQAESNLPSAPGSPFLLGVQWHPERSFEISAASRALFARLVSEAAAWSPRPHTS